jgi:hypothetical protein
VRADVTWIYHLELRRRPPGVLMRCGATG